MSIQSEAATKESYYWLAINGPSVAGCSIPLSKNLVASPTPEQLIGFSSFEEMKGIQQFLLTAPIKDVAEYMRTLPPKIRTGEVQYQRPRRPDPYTTGTTMWQDGSSQVA